MPAVVSAEARHETFKVKGIWFLGGHPTNRFSATPRPAGAALALASARPGRCLKVETEYPTHRGGCQGESWTTGMGCRASYEAISGSGSGLVGVVTN